MSPCVFCLSVVCEQQTVDATAFDHLSTFPFVLNISDSVCWKLIPFMLIWLAAATIAGDERREAGTWLPHICNWIFVNNKVLAQLANNRHQERGGSSLHTQLLVPWICLQTESISNHLCRTALGGVFPISSCLRGVRSTADLQILSTVVPQGAETLGRCVCDLALLLQPLRIFMEERWEMAGLFSIQPLYSGACKIQVYRSSPAQRVLLVGGVLTWRSGESWPHLMGEENALSLSPPLRSEPPWSLSRTELCFDLVPAVRRFHLLCEKNLSCWLWESNSQEEPVTVTTPCPAQALAQSSLLRPGSVSSSKAVVHRVGSFSTFLSHQRLSTVFAHGISGLSQHTSFKKLICNCKAIHMLQQPPPLQSKQRNATEK